MAVSSREEAVYYGLDQIVQSIDKASNKEREHFAPSQFTENYNKLREAALENIDQKDLAPPAIKESAMSSASTARYVDVRTYARQLQTLMKYFPSYM